MRKKDRKILEGYVYQIADRLALKDWTFHFDWNNPADELNAGAAIHIVEERKHAIVRFNSKFRDYSPNEQRHAVIHELIHVHLDPLKTLFENEVCAVLLSTSDQDFAKGATNVLSSIRDRTEERVVDSLADGIDSLVPLIKWD